MNFAETCILDASTLKDYLHCPRRYYWRHIRSWTKDVPALPLHFGSAVHHGLEHAYKWLQDAQARDPRTNTIVAEVIEASILEARAYYDANVDPEILATEELRTLGKLDAILTGYFTKHATEPFKVVAVESPFHLTFVGGEITGAGWGTPKQAYSAGSIGFAWVGRMDLVTKWDYGLITIDHKTTSVMGAGYGNQWSPEVQMGGYITALHHLPGVQNPGIPLTAERRTHVNGAMINALQVAKTISGLGRFSTTRRPEELAEHAATVVSWANRIAADTTYPQNTTSCNAYGECPYLALCVRHPSPVGKETSIPLEPGYKIDNWSPLDAAEAKGN
jgi:hypothetical protein